MNSIASCYLFLNVYDEEIMINEFVYAAHLNNSWYLCMSGGIAWSDNVHLQGKQLYYFQFAPFSLWGTVFQGNNLIPLDQILSFKSALYFERAYSSREVNRKPWKLFPIVKWRKNWDVPLHLKIKWNLAFTYLFMRKDIQEINSKSMRPVFYPYKISIYLHEKKHAI